MGEQGIVSLVVVDRAGQIENSESGAIRGCTTDYVECSAEIEAFPFHCNVSKFPVLRRVGQSRVNSSSVQFLRSFPFSFPGTVIAAVVLVLTSLLSVNVYQLSTDSFNASLIPPVPRNIFLRR